MPTALKRPSAWIPVAMSLTAFSVVFAHIALYGVAREADEGAIAHLWQLLMAVQLPVIVYFAVRWIPRDHQQAVRVLGLQIGAVLLAAAPVFYFHL